MKKVTDRTKMSHQKRTDRNPKVKLPGYPVYPVDEDIYSKNKEMTELDPDDLSRLKSANEFNEREGMNEKDFGDDVSGSDLDITGAELDDVEENIGNEDEENNYYSLGGDAHNDLEEDRG